MAQGEHTGELRSAIYVFNVIVVCVFILSLSKNNMNVMVCQIIQKFSTDHPYPHPPSHIYLLEHVNDSSPLIIIKKP